MGKSLIFSATKQELIKEQLASLRDSLKIAADNYIDVLEIFADNARSISIEKTRILKVWALTKPYLADHKLVIIYDAHLLTQEAQNSLLKILEEPSESLNIVLTTNKYDLLLPTVISRCEIREIFPEKQENHYQQKTDPDAIINSAGKPGVIADLRAIQKIIGRKNVTPEDKKKQLADIRSFLVSQTFTMRQELLHGKNIGKTLKNLQLLSETIQMLDHNVLTRLALENMAVNMER